MGNVQSMFFIQHGNAIENIINMMALFAFQIWFMRLQPEFALWTRMVKFGNGFIYFRRFLDMQDMTGTSIEQGAVFQQKTIGHGHIFH